MTTKSAFHLRLAIVVAFSAVALLTHSLFLFHLQGQTCIDDAYISFAYVRNLSSGHGLVMNPGERVEGYTNFLWVVLMAVVHRLGFDLPLAARFLSLALGLSLIVYTLLFLALADRSRSALLSATVAGAVLSVDGSLARWSQDGMETILFSLLALATVCRAVREHEAPCKYPLSSLYFAVATLTRPEGVLLFAASLCFRRFVPIAERVSRPHLAHIIGWYCVVVFPYLGWRWLYYGYLLPNTFYAKVGTTIDQILRGVDYIYSFASELDYSFSKKPTWVCVSGLTRMYFEEPASFPLLADYRAVRVDVPLPFEYYRYLLHRR